MGLTKYVPKQNAVTETLTPSTSNQVTTLPAGQYLSNSQITVSGDSNLTAGNIAKGVSIFGVSGTATTSDTTQPGFRQLWNSTDSYASYLAYNGESDGIALYADAANTPTSVMARNSSASQVFNFGMSYAINDLKRDSSYFYTANSNGAVYKYTIPTSGTPVQQWMTSVSSAYKIALLANGNIAVVASSTGGALVTILSPTGAVVKTFNLPTPQSYAVSMVCADPVNNVFYVHAQDRIVAMNVDTGTALWTYTLQTQYTPYSLFCYNGYLYSSYSGFGIKLNASSGAVITGQTSLNCNNLCVDPYGNIFNSGGTTINYDGVESISSSQYGITIPSATQYLSLNKNYSYGLNPNTSLSRFQPLFALK